MQVLKHYSRYNKKSLTVALITIQQTGQKWEIKIKIKNVRKSKVIILSQLLT